MRASPDDPIMIEVDAMAADEVLGSSIDSDHGYDDDYDGILAGKGPPRVIRLVVWSHPFLPVDETSHKTILGADELYLVCGNLKLRRSMLGCLINLKRLGSALAAQNSQPADIGNVCWLHMVATWRRRLLRRLRRSVLLLHATSIARIRENAAYGLSHYPHPWSH